MENIEEHRLVSSEPRSPSLNNFAASSGSSRSTILNNFGSIRNVNRRELAQKREVETPYKYIAEPQAPPSETNQIIAGVVLLMLAGVGVCHILGMILGALK